MLVDYVETYRRVLSVAIAMRKTWEIFQRLHVALFHDSDVC